MPVNDIQYDATIGKDAFTALEPTLRALTPDAVSSPNSDPSAVAAATLASCRFAREPARFAALESVPVQLLPKDTVSRVEMAAWALLYTHRQSQDESLLQTGARVPVATVDSAALVKERMLTVLVYHLGDDPDVSRKVADIRTGVGYLDLASDLARLADLYDAHAAELSGDARHYRASDVTDARRYAQDIVQAIGDAPLASTREWLDLRNRSFTVLSESYELLIDAAAFVFRRSPPDRAGFKPLRVAALGVVNRRARPRAESEEETTTVAQPTTDPAVVAVTPPVPVA